MTIQVLVNLLPLKAQLNPTQTDPLLTASAFFSCVHATLQPAMSVGWSVHPLVGNTLLFFGVFGVSAQPLLPKCLVNLFYHCPCPPARDFGNRVLMELKPGVGVLLRRLSTAVTFRSGVLPQHRVGSLLFPF